MKIKLLILCLLSMIASGTTQASIAKLMIKHAAKHRKAYGLLLVGALGFNEYRNHTCKKALSGLFFKKSKSKEDANAQAKAHAAQLAIEAQKKRERQANAALNAEEWAELSELKDKINGMTNTAVDEARAKALVARANANPPADNAQLLILNAAKASIASL